MKLMSRRQRADLFYPGSEPVAMKLIVLSPLYVHDLVEKIIRLVLMHKP